MSASTGDASMVVATIAAKPTFAHARVIARSVRRFCPAVRVVVLLADRPQGHLDVAAEPFDLVTLEEILGERTAFEAFRHEQQEFSYALTPVFLRWLLDRGHDGVLFLKQESLVVGRLEELFSAIARFAVTLTPHFLVPPSAPHAREREHSVLLAGTFNGGVLGVSARPAAREFLDWWSARVLRECVWDVQRGRHFEQRWLDHVPTLFREVGILRDPGVNVGHWNLPERPIEIRGAEVFAGGAPASVVRFSGYRPEDPDVVTRYFPDRFRASELGQAAVLFERFGEELAACGARECAAWPYAFATFADGTPVPTEVRRLYREVEESERFGDPFRFGDGSFTAWLDEPVDEGCPELTRLWNSIYRARPDVQRAFPEPLGADRGGLAEWIATSGQREYGLPRWLTSR